ncbi:MAG: isoprenylcysteine carboxylmethyltransferase family protein [Ruminococcus sp.]|nr:isoprenylcysteine carboxylmethyltransferase family protein [Ruminococcus sp.]
MKNNKHLPVYGIGPILCVPLAVVMGIFFILSIRGKICSTDLGGVVNSILSIVGYIIILLGIILCLGADKGDKLKSNIKENQLKTDGSFRFVRNPRYSTFLLSEFGLALVCHNLYLLIIPVLFWIEMTIVLKKTEEKWLTELYGQDYIDYCKTVNRCIPWLPKKD